MTGITSVLAGRAAVLAIHVLHTMFSPKSAPKLPYNDNGAATMHTSGQPHQQSPVHCKTLLQGHF
ncbi:hypothetical protein BAUCODRAFT_182107 [Baudoinia panamericana UAMH 10762]|uniref:Secreted protein n=1 Tax=Baudoinia panamericana (strain UAMH 10762) TaxID=717646 RepID=M2N9A8_BAUPA|nr:uncharacterized protein BAUCODRAFT_182107 [Baudoinia panamericana UAMH 10762]EMD00759.1 hypothetical protein BAUCODRAFT_182107 [Baudoinia panamericana UAMH 10762]